MCHCGEEKSFEECCGTFLAGKDPGNALELMRSRYSAYVTKNVDYILKTTHPHNPQKETGETMWRKRVQEFCDKTLFQKLEVLEFDERKKAAYVTFVAHMMQEGNDVTFTERSKFLKSEGRWLYFDGEILWGKANLEDFSLKKERE